MESLEGLIDRAMRISILGCNGFLSTAIARYALGRGWSVAMYGLAEPKAHSFDSFSKVNLLVGDFDYSGICSCDIVIYAIGAGIQANIREDALSIYELNAMAPVRICNRLKTTGFQGIFITFGSYFEAGEMQCNRPVEEDVILCSNVKAPSDYVVSKRMLSRFVSSYEHDFVHWHFILPTIYGEGENPQRLIPYVINALRSRDVPRFTSGDQLRQYLYVNEVPDVIERAYNQKLPSGVYNIQGSEIVTVREIVNVVAKRMGKFIPESCFGSVYRSDVGMKYLALDGTRLSQAIGFVPSIQIADVISRY